MGESGSEWMGLSPGTQVSNNVRLIRPLDQGGMGAVWVAEHLTLGMEVAVKFISSERWKTDPTSLARFEQEAKAAASIKSPHVVQMLDHGVMGDGTPYIVMELLEGESLAERLARQGVLGLVETAEILSQSAKALSVAHDGGLVHRDVKPGNIFLLAPFNEIFVKVLDFGIAKQLYSAESAALAATAAHSELATDQFMDLHARQAAQPPANQPPAALTATGAIVGTPHYMSPEQLLSSRNTDFRTDIWALGVVAYQAITGRLPFDGDTMPSLCMSICTAAFHPPSTVQTGVPPALDHWFRCALALDVAARFGSVREAAAQFSAAVQPTATPAVAAVPVVATVAAAPAAAAAAEWVAPGVTAEGQPIAHPQPIGYASGVVAAKPGPRGARWPWVLAGTMGVGLAAGALWLAVAGTSESTESTARPSERASSRKSTGGKRKKAGGDHGLPPSNPAGPKLDRKRFDPIAFAPRAASFAQQHVRDPVLMSVSANGLNHQGLMDITTITASAVYYVRARQGDTCAYVRVASTGVTSAGQSSDFCSTKTLGKVRCTVGQIMDRASRKGAPPEGALGILSINVPVHGRPTWNLIFGGEWKRAGVDDC